MFALHVYYEYITFVHNLLKEHVPNLIFLGGAYILLHLGFAILVTQTLFRFNFALHLKLYNNRIVK
jgi:hypothetical protein